MPNTRIYTVWPVNKKGKPSNDWRQEKRWVVLDVTNGLADAVQVGPVASRWDCLSRELKLRSGELQP